MNGRIAHPRRALATIFAPGTVPFDELPTSPRHQRSTPYNVLRIALGLLLLSAAALKGHQLATEPVVATGLLGSRWFLIGPRWLLIGLVEFELFFGLWLLAGLYPRRTRQAALLCFGAFACVSLSKALSGEATCGCFGRVPVNPWYTFVLDLAAVAALLRFRPSDVAACPRPPAVRGISGFGDSGISVSAGPLAGETLRPSESSPLPQAGEGPGVRAGPRSRLACVLGISLLVAIPAVIAMANYRPATLDASGDIFADSEFVVLEPESWVGKRFPLLKYIDIGDRLACGHWTVVFFRHDCPGCRKVIAEQTGVEWGKALDQDNGSRAFIEVPPYGAEQASFF